MALLRLRFEKNIWGDITGVYDDAGNLLIEYSYDPYGNCTETSASNSYGAYYNPFRYRGYYYDADLGLYYLNSRYYDSNTCRFINEDGYVSTGQGLTGYNMFAYCGNNPVMRVDPSGQFWVGVLFIVATSIGIVGVVSAVVNAIVVAESNNYVEDNDVEAMDKERYDEINETQCTYGLTREEKLAYIRAYRNDSSKDSSDWSEAEMLREYTYHDRGYKTVTFFGSNPEEKNSLADRFEYVNFEEKQTFRTYFYRYIGNCMFW